MLDPFCGSGTTGVAAVGKGCRFVGMDLNPRVSRADAEATGSDAAAVTPGAPKERESALPLVGMIFSGVGLVIPPLLIVGLVIGVVAPPA